MSQDRWQRRIERAEELRHQHSFAAEILVFYVRIAQFQKQLYQRLESASAASSNSANALTGPPELPELVASFPEFLAVVEQQAPADVSSRFDGPGNGTAVPDGTGMNEFPARAFLQPYAEFVRLRSGMQWDGYTHSSCPFCNRRPGLGVLRQLGDGGQRSLICSFCLAEWQFRRILCPACGEENHAKLPVYTAHELQHVRVECCDSCKSYLKTVDLTRNGLAEPVIDEMAAVPLDLWAQEHGYAKLQANLLQM